MREGGVEGQSVSYRLPCPLPKLIAIKVELFEGGVEGYPPSLAPMPPLCQSLGD